MFVKDETTEPAVAGLVGNPIDHEMIVRKRRPDWEQQTGGKSDGLGVDLVRRDSDLFEPFFTECVAVDRRPRTLEQFLFPHILAPRRPQKLEARNGSPFLLLHECAGPDLQRDPA